MTSSTTELAVQKAWAGLSALSAGDEVGVAVAGGSACCWTKFAVWLLKRMPFCVFRTDFHRVRPAGKLLLPLATGCGLGELDLLLVAVAAALSLALAFALALPVFLSSSLSVCLYLSLISFSF